MIIKFIFQRRAELRQVAEAVKLLKGGVDVWSTALELRMG